MIRLLFLPSFSRGDGYITWILLLIGAIYLSKTSTKQANVLLKLLSWVALLISAIAIVQFIGIDLTQSGFNYYRRAWGTLANPDFLGGYLVLTLSISIFHLKWLSILNVLGLIVSGSRAAFLGALILPIWLLFKKQLTIRLMIVLVILGVLTLLLFHERLNDLNLDMGTRYYFWTTTINLIKYKPVFGWGPNTLLLPVPRLYSDIISEHHITVNYTAWDAPHNEILYITYTFGLVGLAAYIYIWYRVYRNSPTYIKMALVSYAIWLQFDWSHIGVNNVFFVLVGLFWKGKRSREEHVSQG